MANIYLQDSEYDKAKKILEEIIKTEQNSSVYETLSLLYLLENNEDLSLKYIDNAMEVSIESKNYYENLKMLMKEYKISKNKIDIYAEEKLIDFIPYDTFKLALLNTMFENNDEFNGDVQYLVLAGQLEFKVGNIRKSQYYFREAHKREGNNRMVVNALLVIAAITKNSKDFQDILEGNKILFSEEESIFFNSISEVIQGKRDINEVKYNGESKSGEIFLNLYILGKLHGTYNNLDSSEAVLTQFLNANFDDSIDQRYWYMLQRDATVSIANIKFDDPEIN